MADHQGPPLAASLMRRTSSSAMIRDHFVCKVPRDLALSIVVLGASGDLAKKKTFPALFALYSKG